MKHASQLSVIDTSGPHDKAYLGEHLVMMTFDYTQGPDDTADQRTVPPATEPWIKGTRYCDQPVSWQSRLFGIGGTGTVFALMLALTFFTWKTVAHNDRAASQPLVVMDLAPLAAPPEPVHEVAPGPQQVERQEARPEPKRDMVTPVPIVQQMIPVPARPETRETIDDVVDPGPPVRETTAPKSVAAPVAARASNTEQPDWEGQIMAHLERFRRYPARARSARQQGTVLIRFTLNRAGQLLSAAIIKKSGSIDLDQAALDTFQRAQPFPGIPSGRPDSVELTMPVAFYLR